MFGHFFKIKKKEEEKEESKRKKREIEEIRNGRGEKEERSNNKSYNLEKQADCLKIKIKVYLKYEPSKFEINGIYKRK